MKTFYYWVNVTSIFSIAGIIFYGCALCPQPDWLATMLFVLASICLTAGLIITFIKVRCPHCDRYLGHSLRGRPNYCPFCGEELN